MNGLVGLGLFLFPVQSAQLWPWSLTPLTARVVGGWYLAAAALNVMLARQQTFDTARVGIMANILTALLLLIGAWVHRAEFDGPLASMALYLIAQALNGAFSAYAWWYASRESSRIKAAAG